MRLDHSPLGSSSHQAQRDCLQHLSARIPNCNLQRAHDENPIFHHVLTLHSRTPVVYKTRGAFQNAMEYKFVAAIERLSDRKVMTFMSDHHVGPDIEIGLFMLAPQATPEPCGAKFR